MKIECTIKRHGGTKVTIGDTEYHFAPCENDERHIAEVGDEGHVEKFLAVPESFRVCEDFESRTGFNAEKEYGVEAEPDERESLAEKYKAKFGKNPHHKMSIEKLREAVK
jgi:hypothetical protein